MKWNKVLLYQRISRKSCAIKLHKQTILSTSREHHDDRRDQTRSSWHALRLGVLFGTAGIGLATLMNKDGVKALSKGDATSFGHGGKGARVFTRKEVSSHDSMEKGVWITYKGKVYDITDFIKHHPGGGHTIMLGAGGDVEPFWQTYTVHQAAEVQKLLASYQIGVLSDEEINQARYQEKTEGPYANDPIRSSLLQVLTKEPFNAETPAKLLTPTFITPTEIFFVRNHLPVPEVDLSDYKITVCVGTDADPDNQKVLAELTLDDLKRNYTKHTIESVIQCSGNRRNDLKRIKEIKGLDWKVGAIGNARWSGARLVEVLESLGIEQSHNIKHVQLEGLDCDMSGQSYGASISADIAFDHKRDALLAYEMNDKPISRDHGFPVRFIAPGVTGARNVKWLSKIILSDEESNSHWQRNDYKSFSPNIDMFNLDYKQSISIQETPVQSAICEPRDGDFVRPISRDPENNQVIPIKGYAYSGGGKMIVRVDVSVDGGHTWLTANLDDMPTQGGLPDYSERNRSWAWMRWSIDLPISDDLVKENSRGIEILCRAFDASYNSQPERAETIWNVRGVVNNSWHKIKLNLIDPQAE